MKLQRMSSQLTNLNTAQVNLLDTLIFARRVETEATQQINDRREDDRVLSLLRANGSIGKYSAVDWNAVDRLVAANKIKANKHGRFILA